jgi:hypothetical protein
MSLRSAEEPTAYRERLRLRCKIIIVSEYAERLFVAQRMSTGSGGDCETPFFLDDSDVSATEFATDFAVPGVVRGRPAKVSILRLRGEVF